MIENRRSPQISVQRRNAASLVEGQLGTGVLIAPGVVLVPSETVDALAMADGLTEVEVVLGPNAFAHDGSPLDAVVERRAVTTVEFVGSGQTEEAHAGGDIARLTLAAPSGYVPVWGLEPPSRRADQTERFLATTGDGGDVWLGMEAGGVLPLGHREPPSAAWLEDAEQALRAVHAPRIPDRVVLTLAAGGSFWCCICPWCCKCT